MAKPDTEYHRRRTGRDTAPALTVDEERDTEQPRPAPPPAARPNDHQLSLAASRGMLRVRVSITLVAALAAALSAGATSLVSYVVGLGEDKQQREATMAEIRTVREQFEAHELRVAEIVKGNEAATKQREDAMLRVAQMQLLEWQHVADVIVALKQRKALPEKKIDLVEAEARVQTALRDGR